MSGHVLGWAWRQPVNDPLAKLLLVKLADQANDDGVCWPSRRTIAVETGMSTRTVTNKIAILRDAGLLTVESRARENGSQTSSWYRLSVGDPPSTTCYPPSHVVLPLNLELEPRPTTDEPKNGSSVAQPNELVAYFVDKSTAYGQGPPPRRVTGQVAKLIGELVAEGINEARIRAGIDVIVTRRLHPATLPSAVHEASLPRPPPRRRNGVVTPEEMFQQALDERKQGL